MMQRARRKRLMIEHLLHCSCLTAYHLPRASTMERGTKCSPPQMLLVFSTTLSGQEATSFWSVACCIRSLPNSLPAWQLAPNYKPLILASRFFSPSSECRIDPARQKRSINPLSQLIHFWKRTIGTSLLLQLLTTLGSARPKHAYGFSSRLLILLQGSHLTDDDDERIPNHQVSDRVQQPRPEDGLSLPRANKQLPQIHLRSGGRCFD